MWKDVTSYSQSNKKRIPTCFRVKVGIFRMVLVWNHRYVPDCWSVSLYGVFENRELNQSSYDEIELAKQEALLNAEMVFQNALSDVKKVSGGTASNTQSASH